MDGLPWLLLGLAALVAGSELLVRHASKLAALAGIPPVVIGLTVVAIGTSTPELAVGIESALLGKGSLAVGNIAGTNIVNILLILGLSAWLMPVPIDGRTLRRDLPVMVVSSVMFMVMAMDGVLSRLDGTILVLGAIAFTAGIVLSALRERRQFLFEFEKELSEGLARTGPYAIIMSVLLLAASIAVVVKGADWLVHGAADLARTMGVSEAMIGLTIISLGTSAPELATAIVATIRNHRDIAVGNLIGSSVYNILAILGLTALVPSDGLSVDPHLIWIDIPISTLAALACIPIFLTSKQVTRVEGALFVSAYFVYLTYLVLARG